jgi:flavin-dependent dehydrogenase
MKTQSNNPTSKHTCDVLVIGGGPAGSTISSILVEKGWKVTVLEKAHHPRCHIGDSVLPMNLPILERLGVLEQVREIGVVKYGAEFNSDTHPNAVQTFNFNNAMDKNHPYAFQVRRSEFDHLLLKNSATKGVDVREGIQVKNVEFRPQQTSLAHVETEEGERQIWEARYVVDATGRDTLLARQFDIKRKNPVHHSAAIFGHFDKVVRRPDKEEGNISIYWFKHGWFWMIPLRDNIMSVGAVCWPEYLKTRNKTSPTDFLWQTIKLCPGVYERMQDAKIVGEANVTGNFTYRATKLYGDGYLLVGDAFAFLDPVFSSGVYLAMNGASKGAEVVDAYLRDPKAAVPLFKGYQQQIEKGLRLYSWLIYRFTSPVIHKMFMAPKNHFRMEEAVISLLAGDVFRKTPITLPLTLFKTIYYITFALNFIQSWTNYRLRRRNVKVKFAGGTTVQDQ